MHLLPETIRAVDHLTAEVQAIGQVPTLIAGVVRHGQLVHLTVAGTPGAVPDRPAPDSGQPAALDANLPAALDAGQPAERDTQYRIGSITKTMTAVLVLRLRDQGRLDLDDPLDRHLPGTPVGAVTLRQLLAHAGGLRREPGGPWWERADGVDPETLLRGVTAADAALPPGDRYHYSNLAYGLLGAMLHRITGRSWWELLRSDLLAPLGMTRTSYQAQEPFARGYVVHPWHGTLREEPRTDTGAMAPAGQLWSTPVDLARWAAFLADPLPAVLAPRTLAQMCVPVVMSDPESWSAGHGLGFELYREGDRIFVGHGGSMPGYVASVMVHRPSGTGVIAFANAYGFRAGSINAFGRRLLRTVLDTEAPPVVAAWRPATTPPEAVAELTGRWWWMGREYEVGWDAATEELVFAILSPAGAAPWRFTPDGVDRWRGRSGMNDGETLLVRRDATGAVELLDVATFVFTRHPDRVE